MWSTYHHSTMCGTDFWNIAISLQSPTYGVNNLLSSSFDVRTCLFDLICTQNVLKSPNYICLVTCAAHPNKCTMHYFFLNTCFLNSVTKMLIICVQSLAVFMDWLNSARCIDSLQCNMMRSATSRPPSVSRLKSTPAISSTILTMPIVFKCVPTGYKYFTGSVLKAFTGQSYIYLLRLQCIYWFSPLVHEMFGICCAGYVYMAFRARYICPMLTMQHVIVKFEPCERRVQVHSNAADTSLVLSVTLSRMWRFSVVMQSIARKPNTDQDILIMCKRTRIHQTKAMSYNRSSLNHQDSMPQ